MYPLVAIIVLCHFSACHLCFQELQVIPSLPMLCFARMMLVVQPTVAVTAAIVTVPVATNDAGPTTAAKTLPAAAAASAVAVAVAAAPEATAGSSSRNEASCKYIVARRCWMQ